jgi:hypothetical protein
VPRRLQGIIRVLGRLRADITKTEAMAERKAGESFPYLVQAISAARVRRGEEGYRHS